MRRQLLRVTLVATTLLLAGCATLQVSSHTDRGLVWSKYKTFDWGPADALPAGDPRLDKDPFFQDHAAGAIERAMVGHGFALSAITERPDVVIHYHANVAERLGVDQIDRGYGRCISDDCGTRVSRHEAATLVVDIVDAETNVLIWRGWAQGSLEGVLGNRNRLGRRIEDSVTQMFETLRPVRRRCRRRAGSRSRACRSTDRYSRLQSQGSTLHIRRLPARSLRGRHVDD